jgi:peptide/nickel transport system substrate-binding protein
MKIMRAVSSARTIAILFTVLTLTFSAFAVIPLGRASASTGSLATAKLNSITLTDYAGNDQSGVADLIANKIQAYDFQLTPSESAALPKSLPQYRAPASLYGLYVNPQNTSSGFNPFYFQQVRFALNYIVDRSYFIQNLIGGVGIPGISVYAGEPDTLVIARINALYSNVTANLAFANQTIQRVLSAHGAKFAAGSWTYKSKPITVSLFDRTDDPIRHAYIGFLASQLQKLGFSTSLIPGTLSKAFTVVFGTDPANATWDIYPASNGAVYGYYDESLAPGFYSAYLGNNAGTDKYGISWGSYNDSKTQEPGLSDALTKSDFYGIPLINSNFTSLQQRANLLTNCTYWGIKAAVYIAIGTSLAPEGAQPSLLGVSPNFVQDPILNYISYLTMNTASGSANVGVRHIENGAMNPVQGDDDSYTAQLLQGVVIPDLYQQGSTGYPYSTGLTFRLVANTPTPTVSLPSGALVFNASGDKFVSAPSGTKAKTDVIVNLAKLFASTKWQDGRPLTLADMIEQYIITGLVSTSGTSIYDSSASATYAPAFGQVLGLKMLNTTSFEIFGSTYYPDPTYSAWVLIPDIVGTLGFATIGGGMMPWQLYAAMSQVVSSGQAAWSRSAAHSKSINWLSLTSPTDVANIKTALQSEATSSFIPPELLSLQTLSGVNLVNATGAVAGYNAAVSFVNTNGNAMVSDGPFYISQYSQSTSPQFLTLTKSPYYQAGSILDPALFAPAVLISGQAQIPPILNPGQSITVVALQTPDGGNQTTPAPNATAVLQLVANGTLFFQQSYQTDVTGHASAQIPSTIKAGTYILNLYTYSSSSTLLSPITETVTITPAVTTSSTSSTSSSSASSSSSTSSTSSSSSTSAVSSSSSTNTTSIATTSTGGGGGIPTAWILGAVALVVIVIGGIAYAVSRRKKTP